MEKANLELIWDPCPAQVDFGKSDFYEAGKICRKKYLTVSFLYSNDGYSQVLKLAEARKNGTLERLLRDLRSLDLLILDLGICTCGQGWFPTAFPGHIRQL